MKPSYSTAAVVGAISGLVLAWVFFAYIAAAGAIRSLEIEIVGGDPVPTFASSASATWLLVVIGSVLGGALVAIVTRAVGRVLDPEGASGSLAVLVPLGAVIAGVISMIVFPLGVTVMGSITEGNAVIGVADMVVLVSIAGLIGGGAVGWVSYVIVRPSTPAEDTELLAA